MNNAPKISSSLHHVNFMSLGQRAAHIHSTSVLERRRRTQWDSRCSNFSKRFRKMEAKRTLLRNVNAYAEHLFQGWRSNDDGHDYPSTSWYKKAFSGDAKRTKWNCSSEESPWESYRKNRTGGFQFCVDEDEEVETIFRCAFFGNRYYYWSFTGEEGSHWRNFSDQYQRMTWNWKHRSHDTNDSSAEGHCTTSDSVSDRLTLGLNTSGPLKLEDVKSAYRACALKWHPDRHQGSSKVVAEEKFKECSAAYKSLYETLAMA